MSSRPWRSFSSKDFWSQWEGVNEEKEKKRKEERKRLQEAANEGKSDVFSGSLKKV